MVGANERFQVTRHSSTAKHLSRLPRREKFKQTKESFDIQNSTFSPDLCRALLDYDIPLWKLNNTNYTIFFWRSLLVNLVVPKRFKDFYCNPTAGKTATIT